MPPLTDGSGSIFPGQLEASGVGRRRPGQVQSAIRHGCSLCVLIPEAHVVPVAYGSTTLLCSPRPNENVREDVHAVTVARLRSAAARGSSRFRAKTD